MRIDLIVRAESTMVISSLSFTRPHLAWSIITIMYLLLYEQANN